MKIAAEIAATPEDSRRPAFAPSGEISTAEPIHFEIFRSPSYRGHPALVSSPRGASGRTAEPFGWKKETFRALDRASMDIAARDL